MRLAGLRDNRVTQGKDILVYTLGNSDLIQGCPENRIGYKPLAH